MICAYADPPYIGCARLYKKVDANAAEVDHAALIAHLESKYPDGWALSLHVPSLRTILNLCAAAGLADDAYRIGAWVKPFASFKPGVGVAYAWEPVIFRGGRRRTRKQATVRDWLAANITLKKGMPGAKPPAFCKWVFEVLNLQPGDGLHDLFPGSGIVDLAWKRWTSRHAPEPLSFNLRAANMTQRVLTLSENEIGKTVIGQPTPGFEPGTYGLRNR